MKLISKLSILGLFSVILPKQIQSSKYRPRLIRYRSWNTKMYPVWHSEDLRYKSSWTGGEVTFDVHNDAPTLSGAKITFSIKIIFPENQTVLPDGLVVWWKKCFVNGTHRYEGEPVYPQDLMDEQDAVFPDGSPMDEIGDKRPPYVFVWKTCGKYWQVSDGPLSSLTISTDDIPLGSYVMDVVIYHYRKKEKFIPIGYASTHFSITDQIPFAVTLTQVNDKDEEDQQFVQNRAIAFTVTLHDPSEYLSNSDITYNWDFGDSSGTVISREHEVTHTYTKTGSFKPHVVVQAAIPDPSCSTPPVTNPTADSFLSEEPGEQVQLTSAGKVMDLDAVMEERNLKVHKAVVMEKPPNSDQDCVVYRYGSFSTGIHVVEGIERVQIVQAAGALLMAWNAVDFAVTCQGSVPKEACSKVSSADCLSPSNATCTSVEPLTECQLVLRHVFHHSGTFCINVSLTNDVSLTVTSAKVNVKLGSRFTPTDIVVMFLGILTVASTVGAVAFTFKHKKFSKPLFGPDAGSAVRSLPTLLWSLMNQRAGGQKQSVLHRAESNWSNTSFYSSGRTSFK